MTSDLLIIRCMVGLTLTYSHKALQFIRNLYSIYKKLYVNLLIHAATYRKDVDERLKVELETLQARKIELKSTKELLQKNVDTMLEEYIRYSGIR